MEPSLPLNLGEPSQPNPPLGLPKGSIRALLALSVFGSLMAALVLDRDLPETTFWYLWMVNYAVLGYYFANRQHRAMPDAPFAQSAPQPLHLPRGSVRVLLILTFLGTCGYFVYKWATIQQDIWNDKAFFPMLSLLGFFLGRLLNRLFGDKMTGPSKFWTILRDGKAVLGLLAALLIILTVPLSLDLPAKAELQRSSFLYIFFYFGSR